MPPAANEYANFLLAKIARIEAKTTEVGAYLALKHFIDTNSTTLKSFDMSSDILKDKEDKIDKGHSIFQRDKGGHLQIVPLPSDRIFSGDDDESFIVSREGKIYLYFDGRELLLSEK